MKGKKNKTE